MTCFLARLVWLRLECCAKPSLPLISRQTLVMSQQAQQPVPSAPDSPALVVTSNVQKYAIKKKKVLSAEEAELFELTQAAGITVDQEVFKIIVDLLKMNVAPQAVFQTLKAMCAGQRVAESSVESSTASHTTSVTTAPTEAREEDSLVSGKSPKPPAAPPSASDPRATRVKTKIVVYGPQDSSSPHSQGPLWCTVSFSPVRPFACFSYECCVCLLLIWTWTVPRLHASCLDSAFACVCVLRAVVARTVELVL
ncbi:mitotic-spindle organizing protein 2 isoform X1 [Mastacembelus armatus]|uniref:mitotic-spindle organizing protein 2 isoform X1 n=1 Tax=Mastacembelus armatus TaxID=205130 RepID=UPI000E45889F|nr:mitotic-spindle organizing protein 2-like isoform X1 [Mastacembelus armatus]